MPDLRGSVGEKGANATHDVALVQAMLVLVKDAKGTAYFGNYTGAYDAATKTAIIAFQTDQKLIAAPGAKLDPAALAKLDKPGVIEKNSATLKALNQALPATHKEMLIIEGTKTVYLPMAEASAKASAKAIGAKADLDPTFRGTVAKLVDQMFADHKIALSIPGDGWNRDFAAQAIPAGAGTGAGPGESNHQYGKAVDIGFQGLRWVASDGTFQDENFWLDAAKMPHDKRQAFWDARNKIAFTALGLFKTNKAGDLIHVQAYSDAGVSYGNSLALLLQTVSPNAMKWSVVLGTPNQYQVRLRSRWRPVQARERFGDLGRSRQCHQARPGESAEREARRGQDLLGREVLRVGSSAGAAGQAWREAAAAPGAEGSRHQAGIHYNDEDPDPGGVPDRQREAGQVEAGALASDELLEPGPPAHQPVLFAVQASAERDQNLLLALQQPLSIVTVPIVR